MKRIRKRPEGTFRGILGYLKPYSLFLVCTVVCAVVYVASTLIVPYLAGLAIDCMAGAGEVNYPRLYALFAAIGVSITLTALSQWLMSLSNNHIAYRVLADVRRDAFRKLGVLPLKYLDGRSYGKTASVVITDAEQFSDGLLLGFTQLFTGAATILGVLVILFVLRWEVALVVLCVTPLSLFVAKFIASHTYSMFKKQAATRAEQTGFIDEMIGNLKIVKAFSHEGENEEKFDEINERLRACSLRAIFYSSTTNPGTRLVNNIVYALVALVGAFLVIATAGAAVPFTVGNLSSVLSYATQYTKPFNEITEVLAEFQNSLACAARIFALTAEEEQPSDEGCADLGRAKGDVALQDVSFSYRPDQELIRDFNVSVTAGHRVAIVGPTGCGKTTMINLLMRFYDVDSGEIRVDGQPVKKIGRNALRSLYGMVLQDTWMFHGSVRDNIAYGKPDATDEEVVAAAKAAHAHSFIMRLPQGYDTILAEDGGNISQGQKQLLCIARAMLTKPSMLILDEATSSIDTRTEMKIQQAFVEMMKGHTSFVVAHRLSTIREADCILVMRDGQIVEQGTHEELLKKNGFYHELYYSQFAQTVAE